MFQSGDKILINELRLEARVGHTMEERQAAQSISVNLALSVDTKRAAFTKLLTDTVCYRTVAESVTTFVQQREFVLVEELVEGICSLILETFPIVRGVSIQARKFVVPHTAWVAVEIERRRNV